jgi:hypothetical protein
VSINDLVGKMAQRASQLADEPINMLRRGYPETTETDTQLVRFCKESRLSRGNMIEAILVEEFSLEFDQEIES